MTYPAPPPGQQPMPPQDHPRAMLSLILGIVGIVLCAIAAPFAWKFGKQAVTEIDASGGQYGGRGLAQAGYVLGVIGTILLILAVLGVILLFVVGGFAAMNS